MEDNVIHKIADAHQEITQAVVNHINILCGGDAHLSHSVAQSVMRYIELAHTSWYFRQIEKANAEKQEVSDEAD